MIDETNPTMCNRGNVYITVKHILVEYPKILAILRKYCNNPSMITMLKETDTITSLP